MTLRAETRVDRSATAITVERNKRDGVVHLSVSPTWIGVRTYRDPATGKLSRELRRPEQVWAKSHIDSLKRLTATHGHPTEVWEGEELPVMLDARASASDPPGPDGTLRRPPALYQVGQVGDEIGTVEIDGHKLPRVGVAIHGARAVADAEAGKTQTSLGYGCLVDRTPGKWTDPATGKAWDYDAEHVLDAEDPRVLAAIADGFDPETLGANHLAVSIARGRGGAMSELLPRLDSAIAWETVADGVVWNSAAPYMSTEPAPDGGGSLPAPSPAEDRLRAAMESAGVLGAELGTVPDGLATAELTGSYSWGSKWRGWIELGEGIAFVDNESRGLWWASRAESGAVIGSPASFVWIGPISRLRLDAGPREDLGEPRLFSALRNADESGVSGTGRVLDGVLWPDGSVATRWRTDTPGGETFATWTHFHAVHVCSHPGNATELPFADGGDPPTCIACAARQAVAAARSDGEPRAAPYPPGVPASILLPARARAVADQIAAKLPGSKIAVKADGLELSLPPEIAGPVADALTTVADYVRGMAGELVAADQAAGEQAAALATAKESIDSLKADRALVEPLLKAAAKAKRDELIAEAKTVAPKLDAIPDDADAAAIRKLAVTARLGTLKRDTADAIDGAYDALLAQVKGDTAGGKDPPAPKPAQPAAPAPGQVIPPPVPPPPAPRRDEDRSDADEDKLPAMYRTDAA